MNSWHSWKVGKTYPTKGGKLARVLATDGAGFELPLIVAVATKRWVKDQYETIEEVIRLRADGTAFGPDTPNSNDLVRPTIKMESRGWLKIWAKGGSSNPFLSTTQGDWKLGQTNSCGYKLVHLEEIVRVIEVPTE